MVIRTFSITPCPCSRYSRDAWSGVKGTGTEDAQKEYVALLLSVSLPSNSSCYLGVMVDY